MKLYIIYRPSPMWMYGHSDDIFFQLSSLAYPLIHLQISCLSISSPCSSNLKPLSHLLFLHISLRSYSIIEMFVLDLLLRNGVSWWVLVRTFIWPHRRPHLNKIPTNCEWCPSSHTLPCFPWTPASSKVVVWSNYFWLMDDHASPLAQECDSFSIMKRCVCESVCVTGFFWQPHIWKLRNLDIFCVFCVSRIWKISEC